VEKDAPGLEELSARLGSVEQRLAELESRDRRADSESAAPGPAAPAPAAPGYDPETFWALTGLKARAGGHSMVLFTGSVTLPGSETFDWQQGADVDSLIEAEWDTAADPLTALGHPVRLNILRAVLAGQHVTAEIASTGGLGTTGQLYHHLRQLQAAGWLRPAGRGRYEIPPARIIPLLAIVTAARP
jgi:DNA-binding transcriptional ArsR family regulator